MEEERSRSDASSESSDCEDISEEHGDPDIEVGILAAQPKRPGQSTSEEPPAKIQKFNFSVIDD